MDRRFAIWPWKWNRLVMDVSRNHRAVYAVTDADGRRLAVLVSAQTFDRLARHSGLTTKDDNDE